jgi:hypothetical protein
MASGCNTRIARKVLSRWAPFMTEDALSAVELSSDESHTNILSNHDLAVVHTGLGASRLPSLHSGYQAEGCKVPRLSMPSILLCPTSLTTVFEPSFWREYIHPFAGSSFAERTSYFLPL